MPFGGPGAFGPLPPMPTPFIPQQNTGAQLAQAVEQFPQQQFEVSQRKIAEQQSKMALDQQKFQIGEQQRKQSLDKLNLYFRMISTDHTGQKLHDPMMIKAVMDAAKAADLGPMTTIDPQTGMEIVDVQALNHLINSKLLSDVPEAGLDKIRQSQPGAQREAALLTESVDPSSVDPRVAGAPAEMSGAERAGESKTFTEKMKGLAGGTETVQSVLAWLQTEKPRLESAGLNADALVQQLQDPSFKAELGSMAQAKINQYQSLGIKNIDQAAYLKMKTETEPKNIASQISHRSVEDQVAIQNANTRRDQGAQKLAQQAQELQSKIDLRQAQTANIQTLANDRDLGRKLGWAKLQATQAHNTATEWQREYDALTRQAGSYITNGNDVPQELQTQMGKLKSSIDGLEGSATMLDEATKTAGNNTATLQTGRPTTVKWNPPASYIEGNNKAGAKRWQDPKTKKVYDENGNVVE